MSGSLEEFVSGFVRRPSLFPFKEAGMRCYFKATTKPPEHIPEGYAKQSKSGVNRL